MHYGHCPLDSGLINESSSHVVMSKFFNQDFDHRHKINIKAFNLLDIIEFEEFSFILNWSDADNRDRDEWYLLNVHWVLQTQPPSDIENIDDFRKNAWNAWKRVLIKLVKLHRKSLPFVRLT